MATAANRKMVELPRGWKFEQLYSKCPECGCELRKVPEDFAVLPETFDELIRQDRRNRTQIEKVISIVFRRLSLRIKRIGQRLADKCLKTWK